ncbi:hypothetical protein N7495_002480 [Penicillium taxi]|uniref:uncharacterized protein n=1 Tax=Penicillium taxi TaxID=168475 RepID=UPI002545304E|nr:uncharacterized protein N7495_002480 [Penicillium taxi]KAJ5901952.1 hypothetical protein N7495_002480 [Penicillium taxi]
MAVTAFTSPGNSPEITLLNVSRLFTRLEHNLLSPASELHNLRRSELQRMRVAKLSLQNVEYARTLLSELERSLPQMKVLDRRHEAQSEIARDRQLLKRMQAVLDEETHADEHETDDVDVDAEWNDLLAKPVTGKTITSSEPQSEVNHAINNDGAISSPLATLPSVTSTPTPTATSLPIPSSTLRSRTRDPSTTPALDTAMSTARTTGGKPNEKFVSAEQAISAQRLEQEDLTSSLLSLAGQLKASSHAFHSTLENEKSVLDRAVTGIDKTSSTMEAAGQRMGMLRKMTEGKGWWGRMMLYAWIFGLWVVALLIVFIGPKLRF